MWDKYCGQLVEGALATLSQRVFKLSALRLDQGKCRTRYGKVQKGKISVKHCVACDVHELKEVSLDYGNLYI